MSGRAPDFFVQAYNVNQNLWPVQNVLSLLQTYLAEVNLIRVLKATYNTPSFYLKVIVSHRLIETAVALQRCRWKGGPVTLR